MREEVCVCLIAAIILFGGGAIFGIYIADIDDREMLCSKICKETVDYKICKTRTLNEIYKKLLEDR